MSSIGLNRIQMVALWSIAQSALISQGEFFDILNQSGPSALLAKCIENGTLVSTKPRRFEMDFKLMANMKYFTTSNQLFFTHSHSSVPLVDIKNWRLSVEGEGVRNPFNINYDELLNLPSVTVTRYLECADNGSIFYDLLSGKKAKGQQWHFGGWGIAEWTGVQLSEILKLAKIRKEAVEVIPLGMDNSFTQCPIPIVKAMEEDTLLPYIMNGAVLPPDHGFPLRALVPGWIGAASTKWVNKIIVSTHHIHVSENIDHVRKDLSHRSHTLEKELESNAQVMKSACCLPWPALLRAGHQRIIGYAWSPFGRIAKVDVSLDGGNNFQPAALSGPNIERAGTRWEFCFDAQPGNFTITPRATDDAGNTQLAFSQQKWNEQGYLFGAMTPHPITVSACCGESYSENDEDSPIMTSGCC